MTEALTCAAPAAYFDGVTAALHDVTVTCTPSALEIRDASGSAIARWPLDRLLHLNAPAHIIRIGLRNNDRLERLEIKDRDLANTINLACLDLDASDLSARTERRRALLLSLAAVASLLAVALYGIPKMADQLARVVPQRIDRSLGHAAEVRVRTMFDKEAGKRPFECGGAPGEAEGKIAFDTLVSKIAQGAGFAGPIHAAVIRREEANAFALSGGHVYVLQGLIDNAKDVDEVAAIIAHELGHIANRDGIRSILQSAGLSLIFGMLLGDFVGGAAIVVAAQSLLKASYSRQQESAADDFAVRTLQELKANPRALATFLDRVARNPKGWSILFAHPSVPDRVARIHAIAPPYRGGAPLLDAAEWQALRRICSGYR